MADLSTLTNSVSSPISFNISQSSKTARPDLVASDIGSLQALYDSIGAAFDSLVARGRESDAVNLKDAAERFAAIGSKLGVNASSRARSLTELKNSMSIASRFAESKILADKLTSQAGLLGKMASLRGSAFDQATTQAGWTEGLMQQESQRVLAPRAAVAQRAASSGTVSNPMANQLAQHYGILGAQQKGTSAADRLRDISTKTKFYMSGSQGYDYAGARNQATMDVDKLWATPTGVQSSLVKGPTSTVTRQFGTPSPLAAQAGAQSLVTGNSGGTPSNLGPSGGVALSSGQSPVVQPAAPLQRTVSTAPSGASVGELRDAEGTVKGRLSTQGSPMSLAARQATAARAIALKEKRRKTASAASTRLDASKEYFSQPQNSPFSFLSHTR